MSNKYGLTAIKAVEIGGHPKEAQQKAVEKHCKTIYTREKGCPKIAFLGLCEEGFVKKIKKGKYTRPYKGDQSPNKKHAIEAYNLLKEKPEYADLKPKELWGKLNLGTKSYNYQMDVVLGLWKANLFK